MAITEVKAINAQIDKVNAMLGLMVGEGMGSSMEPEDISRIVRMGLAPKIFSVGDQISIPWKDVAADVSYTIPCDIVDNDATVELEDGEQVPAMIIQWHYCTPFGVRFDANEALYYCSEALPAGTYYFTIGSAWGSNLYKAGTTIQFTLTTAVPAGGQLVLTQGTVDISSISSFKVYTYSSATSTTAIETAQCSLGSSGTSLGTLSNTTPFGTSGLNHMHRCNYGYNRWSQSALRQYLNSNAAKGSWWTPQNNYDRPPAELSTKAGFLTGFDERILEMFKPIKLITALNTASDSAIGESEVTYDTFFLPSKTNLNLNQQYTEGEVWPYWYRATKGEKPADYTNGAAPITYGIDNTANAQTVRLRSATRGNAYLTWSVVSNGYVSSGHYATSSRRFTPAAAIC
jgi:hypothetical protein